VIGVPKNLYPARVINLSFGGPGETQVLTDAILAVVKAGAIVVAAAGNQGQSASNIYPAATPGVIAVGATRYNGARATYSNYGPVVALMAPGGSLGENLPYQHQGQTWPAGIISTLYRSSDKSWGYHLYEGTSQAAPLVAGVVSLMLARDPKLSSTQVATILKTTANPASKCTEGCGSGLVDAAAALAAVSGAPTPTPTPDPGIKLPFSSTCQNDDQCVDSICRDLGGGAKVCTRYCTLTSNCPADSTCSNGLCMPSHPPVSAAPGCPAGQTCATAAGTVEGGCSVISGSARGWWLPSLFLLALLGLRGARRRCSPVALRARRY
jgi:serine protease